MTYVVKHRRQNRDFCTRLIEFTFDAAQVNFALDQSYKSTRIIEHAYRMYKTTVGGKGKNKFCDTKLLDSAKALKFRSFEEIPSGMIQLIVFLEHNYIVHRI